MIKRVLRILGVALAYYLAARLGLRLSLVGQNVTPIWPPTGIAVAAFLIFGYRVWPGVALAALVVNAPITPSVGATMLITAGNTAAPLASIFILRRFGGAANLDRAKEVLVFIFGGALLAMTISAGVGSSALRMAGVIAGAQHLSTFLVWWTGDAMGVLVFAPALLLLREARWPEKAKTWRAVEGLLLSLLFVMTATAIFSSTGHFLYLVFPLVIWAAVRFQRKGAVLAVAFISLMAVRAAIMPGGAFGGLGLSTLMLTLNAFNGSLALAGYLLAAMTTERLEVQASFAGANSRLEERVAARTAELSHAVSLLETSENKLEEAQEVGHIGSWEWDVSNDAVTWSDELFRLFELEPGSVAIDLGSFLSRVHPQDHDMVEEVVRAAFESHEPFSMDHRVGIAGGKVRWINGRGRVEVGSDGAVQKMVGTAQDITHRKQAEERLLRFVEFAPDGIVVVDPDGLIQLVNAQTEQMFGHEREELLGKPVEMLVPQRLSGRHVEHRKWYMRYQTARPMGSGFDLVGRRKDGSEFPVAVSLGPLSGDGEHLIMAAVRDVTELKKAEALALRLEQEEARRSQALEINDDVVQGLVVSKYALQTGKPSLALSTVSSTLEAAKHMVGDLLGHGGAGVRPGDLARGKNSDSREKK